MQFPTTWCKQEEYLKFNKFNAISPLKNSHETYLDNVAPSDANLLRCGTPTSNKHKLLRLIYTYNFSFYTTLQIL